VCSTPGSGVQADGDRDRLLVVEQQGWQGRAGAEAIAAGRSGGRVQLVAEDAQPLDVVADGPGGHLKPLGQLGAGPGRSCLQRQQAQQPHVRGLSQVIFFADDMAAAKQWYTELLGMEPYFERFGPDGSLAYMEFRVGDYQHELGLIDRRYAPHGPAGGPAGAVANWHVDDVEVALEKLLSMGAKEHEARTERGAGFVTASVVDPFGNILGITYSPQFLRVRGRVGDFELPDVKHDMPPESQ
jgi:predicted enzyme related to lactoylglutathione lyase